ncbi:MAG: trigger factor [Proteobacteria bacterium]|nr:trigger factor [Pseudomonadota bacterium]
MRVTKKKVEKLKHEFNVVIPAKDVKEKIEARLNQIGKSAKIPGFRPGKIPMDILKKNYGQSVMGEVLELLVEQSSKQAFKEQKIKPALQPKIQVVTFEEGKDFEFNMTVEAYPEVPAVKAADIKLNRQKAEAGDAEIKEALERLCSQVKNWEKVDRAAKKGDATKIDFVGTLNGVAFQGGTGKDVQLELGSGTFLKDFEEGVVGQKAGETRNIPVSFPKNYHSADLAGKTANFAITVNSVLEAKAEIPGDDFAKRLGLESIDKLKEELSKQLNREYDTATRTLLKRDLFDVLEKNYDFEVPEEMVELELKAIAHQMDHSHHNHGPDGTCDVEANPKLRPMAVRRVKLGILLSDIGAKEKVEVAQQDITQAVLAEARNYPGQERKVFDYYKNNPERLADFHGPILEEKVVDHLISKASVTEKKISVDDLKKKLDELEKQDEALMEEASAGAKKSEKKSGGEEKPKAAKPKKAKKDE